MAIRSGSGNGLALAAGHGHSAGHTGHLPRFVRAFDELVEKMTAEYGPLQGVIAHEMGHVPRRGERHVLAGLEFVVMHTKGGAVRWFKVSPVEDQDATG